MKTVVTAPRFVRACDSVINRAFFGNKKPPMHLGGCIVFAGPKGSVPFVRLMTEEVADNAAGEAFPTMASDCTGTQRRDESRQTYRAFERVNLALDEQELGGRQRAYIADNNPNPKENQQSSDYEKIVDDAVALMRSDYASMQMLFPERGSGGELRLLAFRGFNPQAAQFWEWVRADSKSTCGIALRDKSRVVAPDIATCEFMAASEDQRIYLQTGIRACQTTPLIGRGGNVVGMISTHWHRPHQPSEKDFQLFDALARQAAELIESCSGKEELPSSDGRNC